MTSTSPSTDPDPTDDAVPLDAVVDGLGDVLRAHRDAMDAETVKAVRAALVALDRYSETLDDDTDDDVE